MTGPEGLHASLPDLSAIVDLFNRRYSDLVQICIRGQQEPVCVENMEGVIIGANPQFLDLLQIPSVTIEQVRGQALYELWPNRTAVSLSLDAATARRNREDFSRRTVLPLPDGPLARSITITPIVDLRGRFAGSVTLFNPPQQRVRDSNIDQMSGLLNKDAFNDIIDGLSNEKGDFAVFIADVDNFKRINDTEGHFGGDRAIEQLGSLIRYSFRKGDPKARYGERGDEMGVLARGVGLSEGRRIMERLEKNIEYFNNLCPHSPLQLSVGLAIAKSGATINKALELADQRMYTSKRAKKEARAQLLAA